MDDADRFPADDADRSPADDANRYPAEQRDAVYRVIAERRDVRRGFMPDPVPAEVLRRVLAAAHQAPSVGLSQRGTSS